MTISPEEFNGERLQIAREFRGLTQKDLASLITASHVLVSYYESGKRKNPSSELVDAFGTVLGFRQEFFYGHDLSLNEWQCNFRHRRTSTERIKSKVRAHAWIVGLITKHLRKEMTLPEFAVPHIPVQTDSDIDIAAERCRMAWSLGVDAPIDNISRTLERAGVMIAADVVETRKVDAFSGYGPVSLIFVNRSIDSSSRFHFDVAHETGHMVMHRGVETGSHETEQAADRFASSFLMPRVAFTREFLQDSFSWTHIWSIKQRWKVSGAAIVRRAYDLRLIGADTYRKAQKYLSFKGYRSQGEPYEPELQEPELLPNALRYLAERDPESLREMANTIGLTGSTFKEVISFDLPPDPRVAQFPSKKQG